MDMIIKKKKVLKLIIGLLIGVLIFNLTWQTIIYLKNYGSFAGDGHGGIMLIVTYVFVFYQLGLSLTAFLNLIPLILKSKLLSFLSFNILNYLLAIFFYFIGEFQLFQSLFIPYLISISIVAIVFLLLEEKFKQKENGTVVT